MEMTTKQSDTLPVSDRRPARARRFRYDGYEILRRQGRLVFRYLLDDRPFRETLFLDGLLDAGPAVEEAARLAFLLAGVSYYKAGAPPVLDLGRTPVRKGEPEFLRSFYEEGLGEFAYRTGIAIELEMTGGIPAGPAARFEPRVRRPLVPFGGGIDSIVTVEGLKKLPVKAALFVLRPHEESFSVIDEAAAVTGLPSVRAGRQLDEALLTARPGEFFNGHVPITGILSSVAVVAAVAGGHDAVVMSNEWSSSSGNVEVGGRQVNHQYSKSHGFEDAFRAVLAGAFDRPPDYFSLLRSASTPSIARRFAELTAYHSVFRSCNRAFHLDPGARLPEWCGRCDKCCFVDLVLAPFMGRQQLSAIFGGREPLEDAELADRFATLAGVSGRDKPFECVGNVDECRVALLAAAQRPDRQDNEILNRLRRPVREATSSRLSDLLRPQGTDNVPPSYAPAAALD